MPNYTKDKIWLIFDEGTEQGPFSLSELKQHPSFHPDVFVKKISWENWVRVRDVPELRDVFLDEEQPDEKETPQQMEPSNELVLAAKEDPPPFYFLFLVSLALLFYFLFRLFQNNE